MGFGYCCCRGDFYFGCGEEAELILSYHLTQGIYLASLITTRLHGFSQEYNIE
jgi:hypothetical protein